VRREAAATPLLAPDALDMAEFWMGIMVAFSPVARLNGTLKTNFRASVTFLAKITAPLVAPVL